MEVKQKCPYNKPVLQWVLRLGMMILGTVGLYFFNLWIAVVYLIYYLIWTIWLMPFKHCRFCYYKVKETILDKTTGKTIANLLPKDKWKECYLEKHVECGKKWRFNFFILWVLPIVLIIISFFFNFSLIALMSLIGFIVVLALSIIHMKWKVCPTCAIVEECHAAF